MLRSLLPWIPVVGYAILLVAEYWLGETKRVQANSTLALVRDLVRLAIRAVLRLRAPAAVAAVDAIDEVARARAAAQGDRPKLPPAALIIVGLLCTQLAFGCAFAPPPGAVAPTASRSAAFGRCVAPTLFAMALRVLEGVTMLALGGQLRDGGAWASILRPLVADNEAALVACAKATPAE